MITAKVLLQPKADTLRPGAKPGEFAGILVVLLSNHNLRRHHLDLVAALTSVVTPPQHRDRIARMWLRQHDRLVAARNKRDAATLAQLTLTKGPLKRYRRRVFSPTGAATRRREASPERQFGRHNKSGVE